MPDVEHVFDPQTSPCTTLTDVYPSLSIVDHHLPGIGRCKVQNFGIAPNGLLPFGYMSDDVHGNPQIDWRSPLNQYLDSTQSPVNISSSGASIAETRCQQTAIALKSLGLTVNTKSAHFYRYKKVTKDAYDSVKDEFTAQTFPGNRTMCELETKCNSDTTSAISGKTALTFTQCTSSNSTKSVRTLIYLSSSFQLPLSKLSFCFSAAILRDSPRFNQPPGYDFAVALLPG